MPSAASYLLGAVQLVVLLGALSYSAWRARRSLLPQWSGAPARLVETVLGVALLIWWSQLLGTFGLLYIGALIAASVITALCARLIPAGGAVGGTTPEEALATAGGGGSPAVTGPAGPQDSRPSRQELASLAVMTVVIAITVFHWAVTTKHAVDAGIFNFDSLWYHMPFAASMAQAHSTTGMDHVETVFTNWFYPQNSELLHAVGILATGRDTLSLFANFAWLGVGFLAAWCIGRPYGKGPLTVVAAAILLECHTLVVRDPGSGKNDLMAAALLLAGIAILVEAWNRRASSHQGSPFAERPGIRAKVRTAGGGTLDPGWALGAAGLAVGLAAGTRVTVLAMAAALSLAVVVLAPAGRRGAAALWWFVPALLGGGYWFLRNLVVAGNPVPEIESLGPISLPHPERLQEGRPDFAITHYLTDTGIWREYFSPGLHQAFGSLWPLVVLAALLAGVLALGWGRDRLLRWLGFVALFGLLAYLFTPLSAAGADGEPVGFGINIRYVIPALLAGIVLVPLPRFLDGDSARPGEGPDRGLSTPEWALMAILVLVFLVTDRPDEALHDSARVFAVAFVALAVVVPALLWLWHRRGGAAGLVAAAALALLVIVLGYPLQRHYLENRFENTTAGEGVPGMGLDPAYTWAQGVEGKRIGLVGTTAGFAGYGFYGPDLSNHVTYLGEAGPHGAYNALPTCAAFRRAVDDADLDYLVTAPFLNFLHPSMPVASPEARWLRGTPVTPVLHGGAKFTVWRIDGELDPGACAPANAPLREIPDTPGI
jgi:hypothetical protein